MDQVWITHVKWLCLGRCHTHTHTHIYIDSQYEAKLREHSIYISKKHVQLRAVSNSRLTCKSKNVIYVLTDKVCNKQAVGSSMGMKERLRNYKSQIKQHRETCNVVVHWWATDNHKSVHPVNDKMYSEVIRGEMSITLVDQLQSIPGESLEGTKQRLRKLEGIWEKKLDTLYPHGLNIRDEGRGFGRLIN